MNATGMRSPMFYLGAPQAWLWNGCVDCRLFVSHGQLMDRKSKFPPAAVPGWGLDSRGFTVLRDHGRWTISPRDYVKATIRYIHEIRRLEWAAPQDHMCEQAIIEGGTWNGQKFAGTRQFLDPAGTMTYGQLVTEHQRLTVANYAELTALWHEYRRAGECRGDSPYRPVLQGEPGDGASYLRCAQMYEDAGIRLADQPLVGVGSVCRLQSDRAIAAVACDLGKLDVPLHWFGLKLTGLPLVWPHIATHDSMAWSAAARRQSRMDGCTHIRVRGKYVGQPSTCANCPRFARQWQQQVTALGASLAVRGYQGDLFSELGDAA